MGSFRCNYIVPFSSRLSFVCSTWLLSSLFLLTGDAFVADQNSKNACCRGSCFPAHLNACCREAPSNLGHRIPESGPRLCYEPSTQSHLIHRGIYFISSNEAPNKHGISSTGTSISKGFFPSKNMVQNTALSMRTANEDSKESKDTLARRVWSRTFGSLWKAVLSILKIVIMKPLVFLKSLVFMKEKTDTDAPVDEETFITNIDNLAAEDVTAIEDIAATAPEDPHVPALPPDSVPAKSSDEERHIESFAADIKTKAECTESCEEAGPSFAVEQKSEVKEGSVVGTVMEEPANSLATQDEKLRGVNEVLVEDAGRAHTSTTVSKKVAKETEIETAASELKSPTDDVETEDLQTASTLNDAEAKPSPRGERWAVSSPNVDLSGEWKIQVTEEFKKQYDTYLRNLGQPLLVRSIALSIISMTKEETKQTNHGRDLWIKGTNTRGVWERTLHASGSDFDVHIEDYEDYEHRTVPIVTADSEKVEAQAWWEDEGMVHVSWLRGGKKYGGGDFYSRRYLQDDGNVFVCETVFHPRDESREEATVTWTFEREK